MRMKIGELARRAGVRVDTVRYYERRGILPAPGRRASGYRIYQEGAVERIRLVKYLQSLGFALDEISEMLRMLEAGTASCENQRPRFDAVVERIDAEIRALQTTREKIVRMVRMCQTGECSLAVCTNDDADAVRWQPPPG